MSIRAVADAVGVTPPSIYRHFEDKNQLLFWVCKRSFDRFGAVMEEAVREGGPVDKLQSLFRAYVRYGVEHPEHYRIMFLARYEVSDEQLVAEMLGDTSFTLLLDLVGELVDAGAVKPELADRGETHVAYVLWSAVHGITSLFVAKPRLPWGDQDQLVGDVCAMILHGVLA